LFAHVYFTETPHSGYFVGGRAVEDRHLAVHGHTRRGRPPEKLTLLVATLVKTLSVAAGIPERAVFVYMGEMPAGQMAEWGHVVPEIGAEEAWFSAMPTADRAAIEEFAAAT
jgi:phenylpyruvate tautomerase PptA (4-oxalocrotonate tautomerase family)